MVIGKENENINIELKNEEIGQEKSYKYFVKMVTEDMICSKDIRTRIAISNEEFNRYRKSWCSPIN